MLGWDNKTGGHVTISYPGSFTMSRDLVNRIFMVYMSEEASKDKIVEITFGFNIYLCSSNGERDIFVLVLNQEDSFDLESYRRKFKFHAQKLFEFPEKKQQIRYFSDSTEKFFAKEVSKKVVILGLPAVGKTSIKSAFFEGHDVVDLLNKSLEPTRGLLYFTYSWLDVKVGLADTSGQEFMSWVTNEADLAFGGSDVIVYVFDVLTYQDDKDEVLSNLNEIIRRKNEICPAAKVYAFCHKIDLLAEADRAKFYIDVKREFQRDFDMKVIFTSIHPRYIHMLFRSMQIILNEMSQLGRNIEDLCKDTIKDESRAMIFMLDKEGNILAQQITPDFNIKHVREIRQLVLSNGKTLSDMRPGDGLEFMVLKSKENLNIVAKCLSGVRHDVSLIVMASETESIKILEMLKMIEGSFTRSEDISLAT